MSERKVLNKYYPPDFDPSKIPRMKLARNRQYTVRLMAPFNMRCKTCGEYIYKGKKFNARKEDVEGDDYLGIRIYRFYIKCTRCLQEISFKTDPKNADYEIEAGATRNFMALKLAEEQAQREEDEEKEEETTNPMKLLEKRTQQSKQELELLESLEELKDLNRRQQTIDYDQMLEQYDTTTTKQRTEKEQEELDEEYVKSIFKKRQLTGTVVEEEIIELDKTVAPKTKIFKRNVETQKINEAGSSKIAPLESEEKIVSVNKGAWKDDRKKNDNLVKKKSSLGIITKKKENEDNQESSSSTCTKPDKTNTCSVNNTNEVVTTVTKLESRANKEDVKPNGLSLLGAYSGSSDNDSD